MSIFFIFIFFGAGLLCSMYTSVYLEGLNSININSAHYQSKVGDSLFTAPINNKTLRDYPNQDGLRGTKHCKTIQSTWYVMTSFSLSSPTSCHSLQNSKWTTRLHWNTCFFYYRLHEHFHFTITF